MYLPLDANITEATPLHLPHLVPPKTIARIPMSAPNLVPMATWASGAARGAGRGPAAGQASPMTPHPPTIATTSVATTVRSNITTSSVRVAARPHIIIQGATESRIHQAPLHVASRANAKTPTPVIVRAPMARIHLVLHLIMEDTDLPATNAATTTST